LPHGPGPRSTAKPDVAHGRVRRRLGPGCQSDRSPRGVRGMGIDPADARAFPGFAHLDDRSVDDLRAHLRSIHLQQGETLFRQGDRDAALYLLVEGTVDIVQTPSAEDRPEDHEPVATRRARTVIGELGLLLNVPRTATVVARTE